MFLFVFHALAVTPPLQKPQGSGYCDRFPCTGITADPTAGIVPADILTAVGQGTRTDLVWTPLSIDIGDGVFEGYLIAEGDRSGNLDTTGGTWFYGTALLDSDSTEDVVAGEVVYVPGESLVADLAVMFDQGTSAWRPTATLAVEATYAAGGSAAAPVYGWTLSTLSLLDSSGATVYSSSGAPVDIALSVGDIAYRLTQTTSNSAAVTVEEALSSIFDGVIFGASSVGFVGRVSSTASSQSVESDGSDVVSGTESATASIREFRSNVSTLAVTGGLAVQSTESAKGGGRASQVTTTTLDSGRGLTTVVGVGPATSLAYTAFPTAGVTASPFTVMARSVGDQ